MPARYECLADVVDGEIRLPAEIVARLRARGVSRVRLVITPSDDELAELAGRGISGDIVTRVALAQGFDSDVAATVLSGEGMALGRPVAIRLADLVGGVR